jgi:RNA binding exosome subunit
MEFNGYEAYKRAIERIAEEINQDERKAIEEKLAEHRERLFAAKYIFWEIFRYILSDTVENYEDSSKKIRLFDSLGAIGNLVWNLSEDVDSSKNLSENLRDILENLENLENLGWLLSHHDQYGTLSHKFAEICCQIANLLSEELKPGRIK